MSVTSPTNAQIELPDPMTRSHQRGSKKAIKARVNKIVQQRQSKTKCRLSDEELVLLALAYSSDEWLSVSQIGEFAFTHVTFFQRQAAQFFFGRSGYQTHGQGIHDLARRVERCVDETYSFHSSRFTMLTKHSSYLRTYGIPVHSKHNSSNQKMYSMTAGAAYAFTKRLYSKCFGDGLAIAEQATSSCLFMKIPLEVRVKIYHLILKVSGFRLLVGNRSFVAHDEEVPIWETRSQDALTMPPVQQFLALLSVNKDIFEEAMPEFFRQNHFQFTDMGSLKKFFHNIGPIRRKHMRNVSLHYDNLSVAAAGARLLTESDTLQKLTLIISARKDPAGHFMINHSRRKFAALSKIPGFSSLKRLRGIKQLTFDPHRDHTVVDAFLRPFVTQPKAVKKVQTVLKRKVESDDDTAARKKSKNT